MSGAWKAQRRASASALSDGLNFAEHRPAIVHGNGAGDEIDATAEDAGGAKRQRRNCVFCQIADGQRESATVYKDEQVVAFLDCRPVAKGHCLVVLRDHCANLSEMREEQVEAVFSVVQRVAMAVKRAVSADGFNLGMNNGKVAGQTVYHAHVHIIPRFERDTFWCTRQPQTIPVGRTRSVAQLRTLAAQVQEEVNKEPPRQRTKRQSKL